MNTITCPHCKKIVEINQAMKGQIEEEVLLSVEKKHQEELEKKAKEIEENLSLTLKDKENQVEEVQKRNKTLQEQLLEFTKQLRDLKQKDDQREIEMQKKLLLEKDKLQEIITLSLQEKARLEKMELQKQLDDTKKALDDAQRKAMQSSQQLQGEVLELDLESQLRNSFSFDEFLPVPKGIEGADIWQRVNNKYGQSGGSILWEIKRTKTWSHSWLPKLREDARKINASMCVLISNILPSEIKHFGRLSGIWVCSYEHAIRMATILRDCLLQIAIAKSSASHKDEKLQEIYEYITSEAFRHKFEAHFESVRVLQEELEGEKRAMERIWKKREIQIQRLDRSASQMFGEIQGIVGNSLSTIKNLELSQTIA